TIEGTSIQVEEGSTFTFTTWNFFGFTEPVDNPDVLNVVQAGQAVPLKWRLLDASGAPVTTLTDATIKVASIECSGTTSDKLEEVAAGGSGLQNLGDGYYQLNWKTPKSYAGSCKMLKLDLGEGVTRNALMKFKG
ncbi:MAG TPA: PxKF domain-containing protein, partial [Acidimicrobiia bacterium]|nr:PxKF domain-containing protein [Acidimicrobiia bacterium]